jgi:hypothetical protein
LTPLIALPPIPLIEKPVAPKVAMKSYPGAVQAHPGVAVAEATARNYREWLDAGAQRVAPDPLEMRDAAWECAHGHLAHDRRLSCSCWDSVPGVAARRRRSDSNVVTLPQRTSPLRKAA